MKNGTTTVEFTVQRYTSTKTRMWPAWTRIHLEMEVTWKTEESPFLDPAEQYDCEILLPIRERVYDSETDNMLSRPWADELTEAEEVEVFKNVWKQTTSAYIDWEGEDM